MSEIKPLATVIAQSLSASSPRPSLPCATTKAPDAYVSRLFARFAAAWGPLWTCRFGGDSGDLESLIRQEWAEGLAGIDGQDIGEAIARCRDDTSRRPGPPDIAEFRGYCQAARRRREVMTQPSELPAETDRRAARAALRSLLSELGKKSVNPI